MSDHANLTSPEEALELLLEEAALNGADRRTRYPTHYCCPRGCLTCQGA